MFKILSVSRRTRLLIERNESLALSGFRVVSPRMPEEAPFLAVQQNVDAVVIGHSVAPAQRTVLLQAIRGVSPDCLVVFAYTHPDGSDEPMADVAVDVTAGPEPLVKELRSRLSPLRKARASLLHEFLQASIKASGADFGNIQLFDPSTRTLKIIAQQGFSEEFLRFFAVVHGNNTACGSALSSGSRVVVEDVANDAIFKGKPSGEMMMRANAFAVQSTPLIGASGRLLGVASTHYRKPGVPSADLASLGRVIEEYVTKMEPALKHLLAAAPQGLSNK